MARPSSSQEAQELGKWLYSQGKYVEAINAFTTAINTTDGPTLESYDQRIACYLKTGEFGAAIKDAKAMTIIAKDNPKGYFRMGQVLMMQGDFTKADMVYKLAQKRMFEQKHVKMFQHLIDSLPKMVDKDKPEDPFRALPLEVASLVVDYLTFKELVVCSHVSQGWKKFLTEHPHFWRNIDLSDAYRKDVSKQFVRRAVKWADYKVQRLTLRRFRHFELVCNLVAVCKSLTRLEFQSRTFEGDALTTIVESTHQLRTLIVHPEVNMYIIMQILKSGKSLEHVEFHCIRPEVSPPKLQDPLPNLNTLVLHGGPGACQLSRVIIEHFDFSSLPLTHLALHNFEFDSFPSLPSSLVQLTLQPDKVGALNLNQFDKNMEHHLPALTHLSLISCNRLSSLMFEYLLDSKIVKVRPDEVGHDESHRTIYLKDWQEPYRRLQHLSIRNCDFEPYANDTVPRIIFRGSAQRVFTDDLKTIDFSGVYFKDTDCEDLASFPMQHLEQIDLSRTQVTGAGVKALVDKFPTLKHLNLDRCEKITSRDIADYARGRGIKVSMDMSPNSVTVNGRRARYE